MTILVVFGSESDKGVYNRVCKSLRKGDYELRIISAHKTPDELENVGFDRYDVIIAGAGLAAHLPGVIASKTLKPVIGVPCKQNYEGLDALLSIVQMPPGIPVMGVGVNKGDVAAKNAVKMLGKYKGVNIIGPEKDVEKVKDILKEFNVMYKVSENPEKDSINIWFIALDEVVKEKEELVIYCPILSEGDDSAEAAINILKHSQGGLWVGINNAENAALSCVEVLNRDGLYSELLSVYRSKKAGKVKSADKKVRKG